MHQLFFLRDYWGRFSSRPFQHHRNATLFHCCVPQPAGKFCLKCHNASENKEILHLAYHLRLGADMRNLGGTFRLRVWAQFVVCCLPVYCSKWNLVRVEETALYVMQSVPWHPAWNPFVLLLFPCSCVRLECFCSYIFRTHIQWGLCVSLYALQR